MKPHFQFLIPARDTILDKDSGELIIMRPFDKLLLPKDRSPYTYPFHAAGKLLFDEGGEKGAVIVDINVRIKIIAPDGSEIATSELRGKINTGFGVALNANFPSPSFKQEGKYLLVADLSVNNGEFKKIEGSGFFKAERLY